MNPRARAKLRRKAYRYAATWLDGMVDEHDVDEADEALAVQVPIREELRNIVDYLFTKAGR